MEQLAQLLVHPVLTRLVLVVRALNVLTLHDMALHLLATTAVLHLMEVLCRMPTGRIHLSLDQMPRSGLLQGLQMVIINQVEI